MLRAGAARASSRPPASAADSPGRASTLSSTTFQSRLPSADRRVRPRNGTRPNSTLSPSSDSSAGSTVTEPATAISTTEMVAIAKPSNSCIPAKNIPAIATMTVSPETSTERPEVAAAVRNAASLVAPLARSSRSRRR